MQANATESIFHSFAQTARFENILGIILEIRCKLIHFTLFTAVNKVTGRILLDVRLLMNASKSSSVYTGSINHKNKYKPNDIENKKKLLLIKLAYKWYSKQQGRQKILICVCLFCRLRNLFLEI